MLKPSECFSGPISDATTTSLILPRAQYEHRALILVTDGKKHAVCLDATDCQLFMAFECETNDNWAGLHVPGVTIELDETSLFDIEGYYTPLGSMVRNSDKLLIVVGNHGQMPGHRRVKLPILSGLPRCAEGRDVCFTRWQIVLGEGEDKRVLHSADVTQPASAV